MINENVTTQTQCSSRCISWTAVIVGALVGVGLGYLLNLFSVAIGISAFTTSPEGITAFAIGGFIGFAMGSMISMFVAGMVAGALGKTCCPKRSCGALYGFTTWVVAFLIIMFSSSWIERYNVVNVRLITSHATLPNMHMMPQVRFPNTSVNPTTAGQFSDVDKGLFILFVLSFLSAFASCIGGHMGMNCKAENCTRRETDNYSR